MAISLSSIDEFKALVGQGKGFAKSNLFYLKLPTVLGVNPKGINLLCTDVTVPGKQLQTVERQVGIEFQKVVTSYVKEELSATFRVLNDQGVRDYFQNWQNHILGTYSDIEGRWTAKYPEEYVADIELYQLKKGKSFPLFNKQFDKKIGPFNINIDLDIDLESESNITYKWIFYRAFPVNFTQSDLGDGSEISTVTVGFDYQKFSGRAIAAAKQTASPNIDLNIRF